MKFERESEGVYRYQRKRVFMKIEGESIVIRVGGGYLTIDEFVQIYCYGHEGSSKQKIEKLMHETSEENKKFRTFYVTPGSARDSKSPARPRFHCETSPNKSVLN